MRNRKTQLGPPTRLTSSGKSCRRRVLSGSPPTLRSQKRGSNSSAVSYRVCNRQSRSYAPKGRAIRFGLFLTYKPADGDLGLFFKRNKRIQA